MPDSKLRPEYYKAGGVEAWDVIEAWELGFNLGTVIKYIARCGRKDKENEVLDLQKAATYLDREISRRLLQEKPQESAPVDEHCPLCSKDGCSCQ